MEYPLPRPVRIHYHRPPDRKQVFDQVIVAEDAESVISYMPAAGVPAPMTVAGRTVLEPESPVVWSTFPDRWHDVGRFHDADGTFTGFYANVLTPVEIRRGPSDHWETTDLFLDVFLDLDGTVHVLDRDELGHAEAEGWIERATAERARAEADRLAALARSGAWPPAVTRAWTLDRARSAADSSG